MNDDERVLVRIPADIWAWIDGRQWHNNEWEIFKGARLPKATKVSRALLLLYRWYKALPRFVERRGRRVQIEFGSEADAIAFCSMLSAERDKRRL